MLYVLEVLEVMRCMLPCMLEAVEGICYVLEGYAVCCSVCWSLEAVEVVLCLLDVYWR